MRKGVMEVAKRLLAHGMSETEVIEYTQLTKEQLKVVRKEME